MYALISLVGRVRGRSSTGGRALAGWKGCASQCNKGAAEGGGGRGAVSQPRPKRVPLRPALRRSKTRILRHLSHLYYFQNNLNEVKDVLMGASNVVVT